MLRSARIKRNRNRYLRRGGGLALASILALLVAPSLAGASPACGVYCPSPVPDPERAPQGGGGSQGSGSGATASLPQSTVEALSTAGRGGGALSRALGTGRGSGKGDRRSRVEDPDRSGSAPAGASLASVGSDDGGLGFLFPLLLGLIGLWAIVIGVRRLRSRT